MQPTDTASTRTRGTVALVLNARRLDELRKAHGIESDVDLARVIGVNTATLYRVYAAKVRPSNEFMAKVSDAFPSVALDQLFTLVKVPAKAAR